jgi:tryptophan-rich sensory protein
MSGNSLQQACQSFNTNLARYPIMAVGLPLAGGFLSAMPSRKHVRTFYDTLQRPDWAPPRGVFAPVWSILYVSIGYASHLVALRTGPNTVPSVRALAKTGLGIYGLNLAMNFAWSPLFFWKKQIGAALVTIGGVTVSP